MANPAASGAKRMFPKKYPMQAMVATMPDTTSRSNDGSCRSTPWLVSREGYVRRVSSNIVFEGQRGCTAGHGAGVTPSRRTEASNRSVSSKPAILVAGTSMRPSSLMASLTTSAFRPNQRVLGSRSEG